MSKSNKIIIGVSSGFVALIIISLLILTGRGFGEAKLHTIYEDEDAIYYWIKDIENGTSRQIVKFNLDSNTFELIYEDKAFSYIYFYNYNTPLVYSTTDQSMFNIISGNVIESTHLDNCNTSEVNKCYGVSDDLVIIDYYKESNVGFQVYQVSNDEIIFDNKDNGFEQIGSNFVESIEKFHYFPSDNKLLYNVNARATVDEKYQYVYNEYYVFNLTTGIVDTLDESIVESIDYEYNSSSDDYLYVLNTDEYKYEAYDSSFNLIHVNSYELANDSYVSVDYAMPILYNDTSVYEFDFDNEDVKLLHEFVDDTGATLEYAFAISKSHIVYDTSYFIKKDYLVLYNLKTDTENFRTYNKTLFE